MIALLEQYVTTLGNPDSQYTSQYPMPTDSVSPDEWAEFDNVFQVHCPKIFMDSASRDVRRFFMFSFVMLLG
jgi:hypothetical protein